MNQKVKVPQMFKDWADDSRSRRGTVGNETKEMYLVSKIASIASADSTRTKADKWVQDNWQTAIRAGRN